MIAIRVGGNTRSPLQTATFRVRPDSVIRPGAAANISAVIEWTHNQSNTTDHQRMDQSPHAAPDTIAVGVNARTMSKMLGTGGDKTERTPSLVPAATKTAKTVQ